MLVPDGRGPAPTHGKNGIEDGPQVRLTESRAIPQVIHPSLLEDPHDKAMLKYYTTGQLALIDVKAKTAKKIGAPAMIRAVDVVARRPVLPRHADDRAVLVPRAGVELRLRAGAVGRDRQGDHDADEDAAARGRADGRRRCAGGGRGGQQQTASDTGKRNIQWNPVGPGLVYHAVGVFSEC